VSETSNGSIRYQVVYSEFVRNELKKLIARAEERGLGSQVRAAVRDIDRYLHEYPQFGQPLRDLALESSQQWVGVVSPLVVHYAIYEDRRLVTVTIPIAPLPHSGL
jgi:hypothetical protein